MNVRAGGWGDFTKKPCFPRSFYTWIFGVSNHVFAFCCNWLSSVNFKSRNVKSNRGDSMRFDTVFVSIFSISFMIFDDSTAC